MSLFFNFLTVGQTIVNEVDNFLTIGQTIVNEVDNFLTIGQKIEMTINFKII